MIRRKGAKGFDASMQEYAERPLDAATVERARRLVDAAAQRVFAVYGDYGGKAGWGWSAGKDSQALRVVMRHAGLEALPCCAGTVRPFEWPELLQFIAAEAPPSLEVINNERWTWDWLRANHHTHLFPTSSSIQYEWTLASARNAQHAHVKGHGHLVMFYGRRTIDGNVCGFGGLQTTRPGQADSCNPIFDWTHTDLLDVLKAYEMRLPRVYQYPRGWSAGNGRWAGRHRLGSVQENWREVAMVDRSIVLTAADEGIESARRYIESTL